MKSIWVGDIADEDTKKEPKMSIGSLDDFKQLSKSFKKKGVLVLHFLFFYLK